jgi:hypothetical protein
VTLSLLVRLKMKISSEVLAHMLVWPASIIAISIRRLSPKNKYVSESMSVTFYFQV